MKAASPLALAHAAKSSKEHIAIIQAVEKELEQAQVRFSALTDKRATIFLDGVDIDKYHHDLHTAQEILTTLEANLDEVRRRRDEAILAERVEAVEYEVQTARDLNVPAYEQALRRTHELAVAIAAACEDARIHAQAIEGTDWTSRHHERLDLLLNAESIKPSRG
jgi:hypothetical protein